MNPYFADWYRAASIDPNLVPLAQRWIGVEANTKALTKQTVLDTVRMAFGLSRFQNTFDDEFRGPFKSADQTLTMRDNDVEMRVLAGATIAQVLSTKHALGIGVALAVLCMDFDGMRERPLVSEIIDMAKSLIDTTAQKQRVNLFAPIPKIKLTKKDLLPEDAKTNAGAELTWTEMQLVETNIDSLLSKFNKDINDAFANVNSKLQLQQEESNILWWLFSGHSIGQSLPMTNLGIGASLVAGYELSTLISALPGPLGAEAFLDRILLPVASNSKEVSLLEVIFCEPIREWKKDLKSSAQHQDFLDACSIHYLISESVTGEREGAVLAASKAGVNADRKLSPVQFAVQMYREELLGKAIGTNG